MSTKENILVNSVSEIRQLVDIRNINSDTGVFNIVTMAVGYVKRNGISDDYYTKEVLLDFNNPKYPALATDNRLDVYNFYNTKLTNTINRKLRNTVSKTVLKGDTIKQYTSVIDSYADDIDDVKTNKDPDIKHITDSTKLYYMIDNDSLVADTCSKLKSIIPNICENNEMILPLVFLEEFDVMPIKLPIFKNSRLDNGETLTLTNDDIINVPDIKRETLLLDTKTDRMFILDKTRYGKITIRLMKVDEIFINTKIKF